MFVALRRIHIAASDFPRSRRFYAETLGLPESGGFEQDWVEFGLGPVLVKLTRLRPGEVPARNQVAVVLSTHTLDEAVMRLKERGVTVTRGPAEEFTGRQAEILDPDGYRIVLFQASELHPDEEWVPASHVDELIRQKLHLLRQKDKEKEVRAEKAKPAPKPARPAAKPAPKAAKPARPEAKKAAKPARPARPEAKKAAKPAVKKPSEKKPSKKK
jgi:predicted enzyme related to lactoylglutathione lyase